MAQQFYLGVVVAMTLWGLLQAPSAVAQQSPPAAGEQPATAAAEPSADEAVPAEHEQPTSGEAPATEEAVEAGEATPAVPEGVEGPLFVVSPPEEPAGEDVREIYNDGDEAFAAFFWFWMGLIAVIAGIGGVAYLIWGPRKTTRSSHL